MQCFSHHDCTRRASNSRSARSGIRCAAMAALGRQRLPQSYRRAEHERPAVRRGLGDARAAPRAEAVSAACVLVGGGVRRCNADARTRQPAVAPPGSNVPNSKNQCTDRIAARVWSAQIDENGDSESLGLGPSDALSVGLAISAPSAPAEPCLAGGGAPSPVGGGAG